MRSRTDKIVAFVDGFRKRAAPPPEDLGEVQQAKPPARICREPPARSALAKDVKVNTGSFAQ